jgi:hypothetical protein
MVAVQAQRMVCGDSWCPTGGLQGLPGRTCNDASHPKPALLLPCREREESSNFYAAIHEHLHFLKRREQAERMREEYEGRGE